MGTVFTIVAPVFGIIALGYLAGRFGLLGDTASKGIGDFAFRLAIPALLFRTVAKADFTSSAPLYVWLSFFGPAAMTWITATLLSQTVLKRPAADAPPISMVATFGNIAMLGLPLCLTAFGEEAAIPAALVLSLHAPLLWLAGTVQAAAVGQEETGGILNLARQMIRELASNPIIIGIVCGLIWALTGFDIPAIPARMLDLLADASVPAALVALGLSLVSFEIKGQTPTLICVMALKLAFMPLAAYLLASQLFGLPPLTVHVVTLMAAMPTGVNAFLFAMRHERAVNSASGAIALGTVLGAFTVSIVIAMAQAG